MNNEIENKIRKIINDAIIEATQEAYNNIAKVDVELLRFRLEQKIKELVKTNEEYGYDDGYYDGYNDGARE